MSDLNKIVARCFIEMVNVSKRTRSLTSYELLMTFYEQHYNLAIQQHKAINQPKNYRRFKCPVQFNLN